MTEATAKPMPVVPDLLGDLWVDLHRPEVVWQLIALAACLLIAWLIARAANRGALRADGSDVARLGLGGLRRVAFPLIALALVYVARAFVSKLTDVHVLNVAVPLLLSMAIVRVTVYVLRHAFSTDGWLLASERWIAAIVWGGFALYLTGLAPIVIGMLQEIVIPLGKDTVDLWTILRGAVMVLVTVLAALWVAGLIEGRLNAAANLDSSVRVVLVRLTKAIFLLLAVLTGLAMVGIDITALSVFGGALGVGLGFGLQKIASNYVSGFIILLERSIKLGNVIAVDAQTTGLVTQITTRYTVVRTLGGIEYIVPNEYLIANIVQNQTHTDSNMRLVVQISVAYDSDLPAVLDLCAQVAAAHPRVLKDPEPRAVVVAFADSGINLEVGFWIGDPENGTGNVRADLSLALWKAFREHRISIPFPQREVRILGPQKELS
jgi:small-conductance mechanosensitive channel